MSELEDIPSQPDQIEGWAIQYVIAGIVLSIGICAFVVWLFLGENLIGGGRTNPVHLTTVPPSTSLDSPTPLELGRKAERMELDLWSWADRPRGLVNEPVDLAIGQYLKERGGR